MEPLVGYSSDKLIKIGKIGSIPSKEPIFRYVPLKDSAVDIYHQKIIFLSNLALLSTPR
jgi:hypothetical protein